MRLRMIKKGNNQRRKIWSGWDGVGTAAVTLVGSIAYFTRVVNASRLYQSRRLTDQPC